MVNDKSYMMTYTISSFNCKGLKASYDMIETTLLHKYQMLFLCEHWLSPHEVVSFEQCCQKDDKWVHMKSSINPEELLVGRPYGGIGFIANRVENISYKPLTVNSDRITGVQVLSKGQTALTVLGVYLPFYNGKYDQIQL